MAYNDETKNRKNCSQHQHHIQLRSCTENYLECVIKFVVVRITRKSREVVVET